MSIVATLAVFAVIPLTVVLLVVALVYGAGGRSTPRYRPGRPYAFAPVWYLSARSGGTALAPPAPVILPAPPRLALGTGSASAEPEREPAASAGASSIDRLAAIQTGGAHGEW